MMVRRTLTLKEPAHVMGPDGEILCTIHPDENGRGLTIDFDHEPVEVKIDGRVVSGQPMSVYLRAK